MQPNPSFLAAAHRAAIAAKPAVDQRPHQGIVERHDPLGERQQQRSAQQRAEEENANAEEQLGSSQRVMIEKKVF